MGEVGQVNEGAEGAEELSGTVPGLQPPSEMAGRFSRNSLLSLGRLMIAAAAGFALPGFLIHRLPVATYSAWVLVLQMSAYVAYLDFGIQTGIAKYVAEFDARGDIAGAGRRASAGLALLLGVATVGVLLTFGLVAGVPHLFKMMPSNLYSDVRVSLLMVGISTAFGLTCSVYAAIFTGLQRYAAPTLIGMLNRVLFVVVVIAAVFLHGSLVVMGAMVAVVNVATGLLQFFVWRRMAAHVRLCLFNVSREDLREMVSYCSTLALWTVGMLCVTGLDLTIVGRYDFGQTAYYALGAMPVSFMIGTAGAALAPLVPAASAMSVYRSAAQMGALLVKLTRYVTLFCLTFGLPLMVAGYLLLQLWLGTGGADHVVRYLRILVLANVLRSILMPYGSLMVATGTQKFSVIGVCVEAVVNLSASVYLGIHLGALGVAYGTLLGTICYLGVHMVVSLHFTRTKLAVSRLHLLLSGILRPAAMALPSIVLLPRWWTMGPPAFTPAIWCLWGGTTALLLWFVGLEPGERLLVKRKLTRLLVSRATASPGTLATDKCD